MMRILAVLRLLVVIAFYDGTVTVPMNTSELAIADVCPAICE